MLPRIKTQLKSFLGACDAYRRFVKSYAKNLKPRNILTQKEVGPVLPSSTEAQLASFEDLMGALLNPPVLAVPHPSRNFVVDVDSCADQDGAAWLK